MGSKSSNRKFRRKNYASLGYTISSSDRMSRNQILHEQIEFYWSLSYAVREYGPHSQYVGRNVNK